MTVCFLLGCRSEIPTYPVQGRVVYQDDNKPVPGGVVIWFESTAPPYHRASGPVERDGKFLLSTKREGSGAMEGEHRIRFEPNVPFAEANAEKALARTMPTKYLQFATSGLKEVIKPGDNEILIKVARPTR